MTQSGLSALIVEKHQETGIDNAVVETKEKECVSNDARSFFMQAAARGTIFVVY